MNMFNCDAFKVLFPTPKLKPVIKTAPKRVRNPKHLVNGYRAAKDVVAATQGKPAMCALEIKELTGVSQTGIRYIMNKLIGQGLATCEKRSDQVRKPVSYWSVHANT